MKTHFNATEVFEMAIRIEENGAAFYRKAAAFKKSRVDKEFFETLARVEDRHMRSFKTMQKDISELKKNQPGSGAEEELPLYLEAMADAHGGEGNALRLDRLTGREPIEEVISMAISLEKESILFYLGLKDIVPPRYGQKKIDDIITEEKKHIVQLNDFLKIAQKTAPGKMLRP